MRRNPVRTRFSTLALQSVSFGAALAVACASVACGSDSKGGSAASSEKDGGVGAGDGGHGGEAEAGTPALDFAAFDEAVEAFLTANGLTGASGVVVHKDRGVVHVAGYGSYPPDRLYLIASSSKVPSVGVLMRLADQGKLDLDAPIGNYLKDWPTDPGKAALTVAQLVSNSSGLVSLLDNPLYAKYLCQYVPSGTLTQCAQTIYTADDAADRKDPDTGFHYGGGPWQLAGGIAEVVSGKPWADLIRETYVEPCGATSFGYTNQFSQAFSAGGSVGSALGYPAFFMGDLANLPVTRNPSIEGGMYTTAEDYGNVLLMHLRGGLCGESRVLSEAAVARMQEDRIAEAYGGTTVDPTLEGYGLGWWVDRKNPGVVGDAGAYGAMPWLDVPRKYAAFMVLEKDAGVGTQLRVAVKPILDSLFDEANAKK